MVNNITRAASLFLVKTLYSFAISLLTLVFPIAYPFQGIQLTMISTLTIGIPTFILALQPDHNRLKGNFLRTILRNAVPGAAAVTVGAILAMVLGGDKGSTIATLWGGLVGLGMLAKTCVPFNKLRTALLIAMCLGFAGCCLLFPNLFFLVPLR